MKALLRVSVLAVILTVSNANAQTQRIIFDPEAKPFVLTSAERNEPSAIESLDGGLYLIADDKVPSLALINEKGVLIKTLLLPQALPPYRCQKEQGWGTSTKWEAMAKDSEGYFYVIGAWAAAVSEVLFYRFKLKPNPDRSKIEIDPDTIRGFVIQNSFAKLNKPKIEGLAVQENDGTKRIIVGLREPTTTNGFVQVYYASTSGRVDGCTETLQFKPLFVFDAGAVIAKEKVPFHLSSVEYVPSWKGLLIVTSTEDEKNSTEHKNNPFFGNKVWFFTDNSMLPLNAQVSVTEQTELQITLTASAMSEIFEENAKAEGLAIAGQCNSARNEKGIRVAIVYDNDYTYYSLLRLAGTMQFVCLLKPSK